LEARGDIKTANPNHQTPNNRQNLKLQREMLIEAWEFGISLELVIWDL
jgi:hypothetical protein